MTSSSNRRNIGVTAGEAHCSQYHFIDGLAKHMRVVLPTALLAGFIGTPVESDEETQAVFGYLTSQARHLLAFSRIAALARRQRYFAPWTAYVQPLPLILRQQNERFVIMMTQEQMELGLATANKCPRTAQREQRQTRAHWWFGQMRQVVDRAFDWEPAPRFQPEQILLGRGAMRDGAR